MALAGPAAARRVALVVGNSAYVHTSKLDNPRNDATDVAAALRSLGFQVIDGFDLHKAGFERKIREFANALSGAEAGVFFYAGHGLQVAGQNYLVPVDAELTTQSALDFETIRLDLVHRTMERETATNILFLDACRNNPLSRNLARAMGTRSAEIGTGLAKVEAGVGTLISFSTQPGNVALDGTGRNSPFTGALVRHLQQSSEDLFGLMLAVRRDVLRETKDKQVPWEHHALRDRFWFKGAPASQAQQPTPQASARLSEAAEAWTLTRDTTSEAQLETYIRRFGDTYYGDLAKGRLAQLRDERQRVALLQKQEEDRRRAEAAAAAEAAKRDPALGVKPGTGQSFRDCTDGCPEMVVVPAGSFTMGSPANEAGRASDEGPQRTVTIRQPFAVGKFEVTRSQFEAFAKETGHKPGSSCWSYQGAEWKEVAGRSFRDPGFPQDASHPVTCVSWDDAKAYASWLTRKTGRDYRLLTEAEWEYTARAGTTTRYHFGDDANQLCRFGNVADREAKKKFPGWAIAECQDGHVFTAPVGKFQPNAFGLHDMHGNVWEWVEDCWHDSYNDAPSDGSAWIMSCVDGSRRVVRGGSWDNTPGNLRSAFRNWYPSVDRNDYLGFRVGRTLTP